MDRRTFLQAATLEGTYTLGSKFAGAMLQSTLAKGEQAVSIQTQVVSGPLPHVWEECMGSDRAIVGLREQWLSDLEIVKNTTGIKSVRFHGLFNDEIGVWPVGAKQPNFLYVDMAFDAMLARGIKPLIELSFMPGGLASGDRKFFFYRGNKTPPKDMAQWGELVGALASHCVKRYGIQEVSSWNFEVWNEPNVAFWAGTQAQYFELYRQSATALKRVDERLKVGPPQPEPGGWVTCWNSARHSR